MTALCDRGIEDTGNMKVISAVVYPREKALHLVLGKLQEVLSVWESSENVRGN